MLVAERSILFQCFQNHRLQLRRDLRIPLTGRLRRFVKDCPIRSSVSVTIEGAAAARHFVERYAE